MNSRDKLYGLMAGSTPFIGAYDTRFTEGRTKADYKGSEALKSCLPRVSSKSFGATFYIPLILKKFTANGCGNGKVFVNLRSGKYP